MNINEAIAEFISIEGVIAAMVVDSSNGMILGAKAIKDFDTDMAAAGNTEVVQAKRKTMKMLAIDDKIEDMLITLGKQFHLIAPLASNDEVFGYIVVDRKGANLGMARAKIRATMDELMV
ncbi:MAG: hypothetical protein Q9N67_08265 [Ghiorsea sp.]|nr:hypothetical protein [Ghiorsea sp.]